MDLYGKTDIGLKRESNQDVVCTHKFSEQAVFAIVCDGMGGQNGGHIASGMTCNILSRRLIESKNIAELTCDEVKALLISAMSEANIEVYKQSATKLGCKGMGTTTVLALVIDNKAFVVHIGDSRVYLFRGDKLYQVTKDHSVVQELIDQGKITKQEALVHPNKNMITRAVGVNLTVDIDYLEINLENNFKLLLCSDGLTNMLSDEIIEKAMQKNDAKSICCKLIEQSNKVGGIDNITVAVIE